MPYIVPWSAARTAALLILLSSCSTEVRGDGDGGASGTGGGSPTAGGGEATVATSTATTTGAASGAGGEGGAAPRIPTPEECEAFTDRESCVAGGCSLFERLRNLHVDEAGTCHYGEEFHLCVVWDHVGVAVGGGAITGWYRVRDGVRQDIEGNAVYFGGLPGWQSCDSGDPLQSACACAGLVEE